MRLYRASSAALKGPRYELTLVGRAFWARQQYDLPRMRVAYHGTPKKYFESLDPSAPYVPEPFAREGFIHTTEGREAVSITLTKYYKSSPEAWVVLYINQDLVTSPLRYDDPAEVFPHIYGPLNRDAIVAVKDIARAPDGTFLKPDVL